MERTHRFDRPLWLLLALLVPASGCIHGLILTPIYLLKGNMIDAEYEGLQEKRVVVVCRAPSSLEYRRGGVDRMISRYVSKLLAENVKKIDVVPPADVDQWEDEKEFDDLKELAQQVEAQMVVRIDLEEFSLLKGPTLFQGRSNTTISVLDMEGGGSEVWNKQLGEFLFPLNSGVPSQEKPLEQFRRQYIQMLSNRIARHFYDHEAHLDFASDSLAHK